MRRAARHTGAALLLAYAAIVIVRLHESADSVAQGLPLPQEPRAGIGP